MTEDELIAFGSTCDAFLDGSLSPREQKAFEATLLASETARQEYVRRSGMLSSLRHYATEAQSTAAPDEHQLRSPVWWQRPSALMLAAMLILTLVSGIILRQSHNPVHTRLVALAIPEQTFEGVAVLMQAYDVVWADGQTPKLAGESIPPGRFRMDSGVVQLEFYSGATVVLQGATDLEIFSDQKAFCHYGKASVSVSPHARGFSIATPDVDFVDLGTEFGIDVRPGKPSELHVFSGKVEVYPSGEESPEALVRTLETGEAARFRSADEIEDIAVEHELFWDGRKLARHNEREEAERFAAWKTFSDQIATGDDIIRYFPFYKTDPWNRVLQNTASPDDPEKSGAIVGGIWESGRWPEKSALRFNTPSDRVRFNIAGEYEQITLAAWVKVESLNNAFNGLFMTDQFTPGNPHWQMNAEGELILGVKAANNRTTALRAGSTQYVLFSPPVITADQFGQWVHLASTFDVRLATIKHYMNGKLIAEQSEDADADTQLRFGTGELGNWGLPRGTKPNLIRNFDGAIDEMLLSARVFSAGEIFELYELGRPGEHSRSYSMMAQRMTP